MWADSEGSYTCPAFWPQLSHSRFFSWVGGCFHDQILWMQCVPTRIILAFISLCWWIVEFPELRAWTAGRIWPMKRIFFLPSVVKSWLVGVDIFVNNRWYIIISHVNLGNSKIVGQIRTCIGEEICIFWQDTSALPLPWDIWCVYFRFGITYSYRY